MNAERIESIFLRNSSSSSVVSDSPAEHKHCFPDKRCIQCGARLSAYRAFFLVAPRRVLRPHKFQRSFVVRDRLLLEFFVRKNL